MGTKVYLHTELRDGILTTKSRTKSRKTRSVRSRTKSRKTRSVRSGTKSRKPRSVRSRTKSRKPRSVRSRTKSRKPKSVKRKDKIQNPSPVKTRVYRDIPSDTNYSYSDVYLRCKTRIELAELLINELYKITKTYGEDCVNGPNPTLLKYFEINKLLGVGNFGNVYSANLSKSFSNKSFNFAIKLAAFITKSHYKKPYNYTKHSWSEILISQKYLNPLIEKNICPNLPFMFDNFVCNSCQFLAEKPKECIIVLMELGSGDLDGWFKIKKRTSDEIYSCLFQIMAAIHAIQFHCQIVNNDIKTLNILYHTVKPGGFWHYIIHGIDFYVPNCGYVFILNDFGVSIIKDPLFTINTQESEIRSAMIINNTFSFFNPTACVAQLNGKISTVDMNLCSNILVYTHKLVDGQPDINKFLSRHKRPITYIGKNRTIYDCKINFTDEQKIALKRLNIPIDSGNIDFYKFPEIIPPCEFSIDTQDCIRMFLGGKRVNIFPPANHKKYDIPDIIKSQLNTYYDKFVTGRIQSMYTFNNPEFYVAGYFIEKFFTIDKDYTRKPKDTMIDTYIIS